MVYRCERCNELFDDPLIHNWRESHGESMSEATCPDCGGDCVLVELEHCRECGGDYEPSDVYDGICENCLKSFATYENFFKFASEEKPDLTKVPLFEDFVFAELLGNGGNLTGTSFELREVLIDFWREAVKSEKHWVLNHPDEEPNILSRIWYYLQYAHLLEEFAEFINEKRNNQKGSEKI